MLEQQKKHFSDGNATKIGWPDPSRFLPFPSPQRPPTGDSGATTSATELAPPPPGLPSGRRRRPPEYVTSTTKCLVQKIHNEWPLSDIVGNITHHSR